MDFDEFYMRLSFDTRKRVAAAAMFVPRLAPGHGSLRAGECNAAGCDGSDKHYQERTEIAYRLMFGRGELK